MEWITALSQFFGSIAWPLTAITLFIMFRREIRHRLSAVTEVKYPGGSITMKEVERLEAKVEATVPSGANHLLLQAGRQALQSMPADPQLAIAEMRLDTEKELFLLARVAVPSGDPTSWSLSRHIEELQEVGVLPSALADGLRDFVSIANKVLHDPELPPEVALRATTTGGLLVAFLRHKRFVLEAFRNFEAHGLWHMHRHLKDEQRKYYFWSAVAASLPELAYDYDVYREAAELYNQKVLHHGHGSVEQMYILPVEEFLSVLEFREHQLQRLVQSWNSSDGFGKANEWQWPSDWGELGWCGPILHERAHLNGAQEDLMRTRAALARHRARFLSHRRHDSQSDRRDEARRG